MHLLVKKVRLFTKNLFRRELQVWFTKIQNNWDLFKPEIKRENNGKKFAKTLQYVVMKKR